MSADGGRALALDGWTLAMACEQFAEAGVPVDEARFRIAVTRVVRLGRQAEMPSGPKAAAARPCTTSAGCSSCTAGISTAAG